MKITNSLQIRHKLWLLIAVPAVFMALFAVTYGLERRQDLQSANNILHLTQVTELLNVVHHLQFERGKAAALAIKRSSEAMLEWQEAIKRTDSITTVLPKFKEELISLDAEKFIINTVQSIQQSVVNLTDQRNLLASNLGIDKDITEATYSSIIDNIQQDINKLVRLVHGSNLYQLIESITTMATLKEVTGQQRVLVNNILNKGYVTKEEISNLIALRANEQISKNSFMSYAFESFQDTFVKLQLNMPDEEIESTIASILKSSSEQAIKGDAGLWYQRISQRMNSYRQIEDDISEELVQFANQNRIHAKTMFYATIATSLIILLLLFRFALIATSRLTDGFVKLRDSAVQYTNTGELSPVQIESKDELGEVAQSFNQLFTELESISKVVESVANGDFSQSVNEKSEHDQLSISLNHMVKTLHQSVNHLKHQNWIKTGQNDLAFELNNEQSLHALANKSISFLAHFINANIGIFYTVDHDNTSSICASYALSNLDMMNVRYKVGESLVGQAVAEQKNLILDSLPSDYLSITSGCGSSTPNQIVIFPLTYANKVLAVIELGSFNLFTSEQLEFIDKIKDSLAIAVHAAVNRENMAELLEETQVQSEELQAQQEELEQTNFELNAQTIQLSKSQEILTEKQQQLVKSNEELLLKTNELEKQNKEIEERSEELALASKYKSEFLANMSHELRTPLNSLLLLSETLLDNDEDNLTSEQVEALSVISGSGHDLLNLINDILDLSKVEAGKLDIEVQLCKIDQLTSQMDSQFKHLAEEKSLSLDIIIDESAPQQIQTDINRLQQILKNLLSNAIKFTDKGYVRLIVGGTDTNNIQFIVKDSGIGVHPKLKNAVFEAFQQGDGSIKRKYSGTGLGLTISRELAGLLGGTITLQSNTNKGATFILELPTSLANANNEPINAYDEPKFNSFETATEDFMPRSKAKTKSSNIHPFPISFIEQINTPNQSSSEPNIQQFELLIVEDDLNFSQQLTKMSEKHHFKCLHAENIMQCKKILSNHSPDAFILDMLLPDGNSDILINAIRANEKTKNAPIHIITSLDKEQVQTTKSNSISTKPVSKTTIQTLLTNIQQNLVEDKKYHLLIIEDDISTTKSLKLLLNQKNIKVTHAANGLQALTLLSSSAFNCIILDLNLPDINQWEILEQIAKLAPQEQCHLIIYTASELSHRDYKKLRLFTENIIIKGSIAQERLLDEVDDFLREFNANSRYRSNSIDLQSLNDSLADMSLAGKTILVVDDDMRNTFALSKLLKKHGMNVIMADNGQMALDKLSESSEISIALMDIMMPVMDGYETIKNIRNSNGVHKKLPIIAVTAKAMPEDRKKCLQAGANDYITKPVNSTNLVNTIKSLVVQL